MVIHDLDVEGVAVEPAKAHAPLVVDSNAELSHPVAGESFQPIPRRSAKICEVDRCIELSQATQRGALQLRTQTSDREPFEQPPRIPIAKAANHWRIVTRRVIADKRHPVQEADGARYAARGAGTSPFCPVAGPKSASTIHEAVQLVLQAGALGEGSELFVLDMGEPIKIVDLARDLIRLSGLDEGTDIEIEFTGIRPGEKLYEEVFFGHEDVRSTHHPKVLRTISTEPDAGFADAVDALIRQVTIRPVDLAAVRDALRAMVPDFAVSDARTSSKQRPSPYPTARDTGQTAG